MRTAWIRFGRLSKLFFQFSGSVSTRQNRTRGHEGRKHTLHKRLVRTRCHVLFRKRQSLVSKSFCHGDPGKEEYLISWLSRKQKENPDQPQEWMRHNCWICDEGRGWSRTLSAKEFYQSLHLCIGYIGSNRLVMHMWWKFSLPRWPERSVHFRAI